MQHSTFDDLQRIATTVPAGAVAMSRRQRLHRWATLLEQEPHRPVKLLRQVEYLSHSMLATVRADDSPLAVAFADPVFRLAGLSSDLLGDIESFFELSQRQAHYLLCDCHYQGSATSGQIGARIRAVASRKSVTERWAGVRQWVASIW